VIVQQRRVDAVNSPAKPGIERAAARTAELSDRETRIIADAVADHGCWKPTPLLDASRPSTVTGSTCRNAAARYGR